GVVVEERILKIGLDPGFERASARGRLCGNRAGGGGRGDGHRQGRGRGSIAIHVGGGQRIGGRIERLHRERSGCGYRPKTVVDGDIGRRTGHGPAQDRGLAARNGRRLHRKRGDRRPPRDRGRRPTVIRGWGGRGRRRNRGLLR